MGLCKCKNVTNLFCFQHRKNVCESCILSTHQTCVIKSYLQWLQDSDFDSTCFLCTKPLEGELCRLVCLDLFHLECLNAYCEKKPKTTLIGGYTCPCCNARIVPKNHVAGKLADNVRQVLKDAQWLKALESDKSDGLTEVTSLQNAELNSTVTEPLLKSKSEYKDNGGIIPSSTFKDRTTIDIDPDDAKYKQGTSRTTQDTFRSILPRRLTLKRGILYVMGLFVVYLFYEFVSVGREVDGNS